MTPAFNRRDAALRQSKALPAAASGNTITNPINVYNTPQGHFLAGCELEVSAPALTTTMLPDTRTATYDLLHSDEVNVDGTIKGPVVLQAGFILQTGAGGAGAAAVTKKIRPQTSIKKFVALRCTLGASTTDSSARSMTLDMLF